MAIESLDWSAATDGLPVTAANSGYTGVDLTDSGGSIVYDDAWLPHGHLSMISTGTTNAGRVMGYRDFSASDAFAMDQPVRTLALPASASQLMYVGTGETRCVSVDADPTGTVQLRDAAGAVWTSAAGVLEVGRKLVLSLYVVRHATAGSCRLVVYEENGTTVRADSTLFTGRNTGAAALTRFRGSVAKTGTTSTIAASYAWGEPRWDRAASGLLPAWRAHMPFSIWSGSAYVEVDLYTWNGSAYVPVSS